MATLVKAHTFRAFRSRNYALYFAGQSVSQIGTWMQRTGVSWVVYTMTHSALMLGVTMFAQQFPSFMLSLFGGIVSDRYHRYKILLITQTLSMLQAVLLAVLTLTHHFVVWEILALSVLLGVINAFDVPARQPLVHDLVTDKADLPNAIAFNSSMNNFARLVGPALSGIVLQHFGAGKCFLLNAASFVAVLLSLLLMKLPSYQPNVIKKDIMAELSDGFAYLRSTPKISLVLLILALVSLFVLPYNTLLPIFAKVIFMGNAATFGYINSFIGLGAIIGTFVLASMKPGTNMRIILLVNTLILGVGLILFSHATWFPLAMLFAVISGYGTMSQTSVCITIIQVEADKNMRGRVISYLAMAYFGMMPLGGLLIGAISQLIGAPNTILCQGIMAFLIIAVFFKFLRQPIVRQPTPAAEDLTMNKRN